MRQLVLATKNPAKVRRYLTLLSGVKGLNLLSLADFPATVSVDEPFLTAEENARHKAREYSRMLNECVLTIDEALYVDFLPEEEQPGVHVRRIDKSTEAADQEIYDYWKRKIDEVGRECRGYFRQSLCICTVEGLLFERTVDRHFLFANPPSPYFSPGYPFSAFRLDPGVQKVYYELSDTEKIVVDKKDLACVYDLVSDFLSA